MARLVPDPLPASVRSARELEQAEVRHPGEAVMGADRVADPDSLGRKDMWPAEWDARPAAIRRKPDSLI